MKKQIALLMAAALIFALAACGQTQKPTETAAPQPSTTEAPTQTLPETEGAAEAPEETEASAENGKTLVVYYSWSTSGNTQKMAEFIQQQTGGDILELIPQTPYPTDYNATGDIAKEERDTNARPEIAGLPESIAEYDMIFLGYPIWWHTAPMIIGTFLESFDLSGKDIYPFSQSASMDTEQFAASMDFVRENAAGANVHDGLFASASDTEGMLAYLTENGFAK